MPRDPRSRPGPRVAAKRELIVETPSERSPSRVPGRQGGGRRGRARHLEGLGLSALREQGRLVPRRAEPSRRSPRGSTRQTTSERKASGRCSSTGSNGRSTSCRRTGPVSGDAHGHLRDRPGAANGDQPVHGQRRSVRDARVRGSSGSAPETCGPISTWRWRRPCWTGWPVGSRTRSSARTSTRSCSTAIRTRAAAGPADRAVRGPASPFARCGAVERTAQEAGRRRMADLASATVTFPLR